MTTTGIWYAPALGIGGQLLTNPSFRPMTTDITTTLEERGKRYGEFKGNAEIAQQLKRLIALHPACGTGGVLLQNPPWAGGGE